MTYEQELAAWRAKHEAPKPRSAPKVRTQAEYREPSPDEAMMIKGLEGVTYPAASWDKRFMRGLVRLTESGSVQLARIFIRYRRQVQHPEKERLLALAHTIYQPPTQ